MSDLLLVGVALVVLSLTLPASVVFLALRLKGGIAITVQAPTALIPAEVTDILRRLEEKLHEAQVPLDDTKLSALVYEAVRTAENTALKGHDKFKLAREAVLVRLKELNMATPDSRALALRIEGAVGMFQERAR